MNIFIIVLETLIVVEIAVLGLWICKRPRRQEKTEELQETSKMVKQIYLRNKWESIDDMIDILRKDSIHIDFKL